MIRIPSPLSFAAACLRGRSAWQMAALAFGLAPAALLLAAGCAEPDIPPAPKPAPPPAQQASAASGFVGNAACADCHPKEFQSHKGSRHDYALRLADSKSLGSDAPAPGRIPGTEMEWTAQGEGFGYGRADGPSNPLQLAWGSGKAGIAFTASVSNEMMAEARMSYYPPKKKWFVTPGQQSVAANALGNLIKADDARQCFGCHTTTVPTANLMPEPHHMGVGCESCHGPGGEHVAAARAGKATDLHMPDLSQYDGVQINDLCGRCHRTERQVVSEKLSHSFTDLFQAFGLSQSRCFKESGKKLTCLTCHDAHADVSTDERGYVQACLRCHAPPETNVANRLVQARICPVNAKEKCIGCHMPTKNRALYPGQPRHVADHFIRVVKEGRNAPGKKTAAAAAWLRKG